MGFEFRRPGSSFDLNRGTWQGVYELGLRHGWSPRGTKVDLRPLRRRLRRQEHDPDEVDVRVMAERARHGGTYFSNDGQTVTAGDAAALADALDRALPTLSEVDREFYRRVIAFLRGGAFRIW